MNMDMEFTMPYRTALRDYYLAGTERKRRRIRERAARLKTILRSSYGLSDEDINRIKDEEHDRFFRAERRS